MEARFEVFADVSESLQAAEESEAIATAEVTEADARGLRGLSKLRLQEMHLLLALLSPLYYPKEGGRKA